MVSTKFKERNCKGSNCHLFRSKPKKIRPDNQVTRKYWVRKGPKTRQLQKKIIIISLVSTSKHAIPISRLFKRFFCSNNFTLKGVCVEKSESKIRKHSTLLTKWITSIFVIYLITEKGFFKEITYLYGLLLKLLVNLFVRSWTLEISRKSSFI